MKPYQAFSHLFFRDLEPGELPFKLVVEVTNRCNLRCTTCPRETSGRGYGDMDDALFESLARQAAGRRLLFYPQGFGESLLHPRYAELLGSLQRLGVRHVVCISNGTLLDEAACRLLIGGTPRMLIISLDGGEKQVYEAIRVNARYEQVVENVERFLRLRDESGARRPFLSLSVIGTDTVLPTVDALRARWQPLLRRTDEIFVCTPITWAGTWPTPGTPLAQGRAAAPVTASEAARRPPCRMLYKTLSVFRDGRVTPCTSDHGCVLEIGNAREESLVDLWNGERLAELRRLHEQGRSQQIPLCRHCPEPMP